MNNIKEYIVDKVGDALKEQGYKNIKSNEENTFIFSLKDRAYIVFFDVINKRLNLEHQPLMVLNWKMILKLFQHGCWILMKQLNMMQRI